MKKHGKADGHGPVGRVVPGGQHPQADEHQVVGGVGHGVHAAAKQHEVRRQKAGADGQGAQRQLGGMEVF